MVQYGPRRMKLRDLMAATLRFLQNDCATYRVLWDWSPCVSQLLTSDIMVRGYGSFYLVRRLQKIPLQSKVKRNVENDPFKLNYHQTRCSEKNKQFFL